MNDSKIFFGNAIAYVRFFNKELENIYSLEEQKKAITDFADEKGINLIKIFPEKDISAKNFDRPAFKEMMEYIKLNRKIKFLIVTDIGRLSNNSAGLQRLRRFLKFRGIKVISIVDLMLRYACKQPKQHS